MAKQRAKTQGHTNKWQKAHVQVTVERFSVSVAIKKSTSESTRGRIRLSLSHLKLSLPNLLQCKAITIPEEHSESSASWQITHHSSVTHHTAQHGLQKQWEPIWKAHSTESVIWRQPVVNLFVNDDLAQLPEWAKNLILPNNKHCTVFLSVMGPTRDLL